MTWVSRTYQTRVSVELRRRIASAALLAPIAILLIALGGFPFFVLCVAAAAVVLVEWNAIASGGKPGFVSGVAIVTLIGSSFLLDQNEVIWAFAALAAGCVVVGLLALRSQPRPFWAILGLLYAGILPFGGILLRADPQYGFVAVVWLLIVVWASDTGAFAAGRTIGGPKLWPAVSPKKTWSGLLGGLALAAVVGGFLVQLALGVPFEEGVVLSAAFAAVAQAGDLAESAFKRHFSVKDASHLIPGHGGLMDRIDSLVAALAVAVVVGLLRGPDLAQGLLFW